MENEYEKFYDEVKNINGVLRVTIPKKLVDFTGIKEGDNVKVMIKKYKQEWKILNKQKPTLKLILKK